MSDPMSPPFRDSDALRIIIRRLELIEDRMRTHTYDEEFLRQMTEVSEWLDWLSQSINDRTVGNEPTGEAAR